MSVSTEDATSTAEAFIFVELADIFAKPAGRSRVAVGPVLSIVTFVRVEFRSPSVSVTLSLRKQLGLSSVHCPCDALSNVQLASKVWNFFVGEPKALLSSTSKE